MTSSSAFSARLRPCVLWVSQDRAAQSSPCMNVHMIDQATQEHSMDALALERR